MRAVRCVDQRVQVVDLPRPADKPDGVRVRLRSAGICGSDLHLLTSDFPLPQTLGHEMAGVLSDGRAVAIEPLAPCGECQPCLGGDYNLCVRGAAILLGLGHDGGMADEIVVSERCLVPLLPGVRPEDACLVEPLAVAVHGLRLAALKPGQRVAVIGGGTIGLCAVAAAVRCGGKVSLQARHDHQREVAVRLGAELEPEGAFDLVIDCAGTSTALAEAIRLCRPRGKLLLLGSYWEGMELPGFELCLKEVQIIPSSMYGMSAMVRDIDVAASLLAERPELPDLLITHRFPLDAAVEAFEKAHDRVGGVIKVVLEPGAG
ncbi:MAG: alcohol dehydrogenase catalytic domain-containing protein [Myxococcota bacterium]